MSHRAVSMLFTITLLLGVAALGIGKEPISEPALSDDVRAVWVAHLRRCLKKVFSIRAAFTQEHLHPGHAAAEPLSGTIEVRRGGRYRLAYEHPEKRLVVSDGETVWAYDPTEKTAYTSSKNETVIDDFLAFLAGAPGSGESPFTTRFIGGASAPRDGVGAIELIPNEKKIFVASIVLTLDAKCPCIKRVMIAHHDGSVTRMTFSNTRFNVGIGKRRFMFKPPRRTRIIEP